MKFFGISKIRKAIGISLIAFVTTSLAICLILRWLPPPTSAFMLYCHYNDLLTDFSYKPIKHRWVPYSKISSNAVAAVLAAEDQRFYQHAGFDLNEIQSSIDTYMDGGKLRGASTITQQVAKNLFLTPSKNFLRKGIEAWFTFLIELFWSKQRILEVYLNIVELGDHLYGIEAASRYYFGVTAKNLSRSQAALLASTLPNPIVLQAATPSSYLLKKQQWVLKQMSRQ